MLTFTKIATLFTPQTDLSIEVCKDDEPLSEEDYDILIAVLNIKEIEKLVETACEAAKDVLNK